jgi:NIMA (never in mitosis gene a)-related kinase
VCGTPYYAAPEILQNKPYDHKADVFAFGVLVLELLTRRCVNIDRISNRDVQTPSGVDLTGLLRKIPKSLKYPPPMMKLAQVAVEYDPSRRPTMNQIVQIAAQIEKALNK